ncbi:MAG TPA: TadE/TadG family type IV pilus assembly protein [Lichenihabitans sp.]|jgi:Flp pilus assembly protein TadG|nr:TadE/TadG family type IV pilus assembly protein [Lichenihabitans sp.]
MTKLTFRKASCRDGAVAVEFAFLAPILIVMLFGIMEFGLIFYTFLSAQSSARDITRRLSLNQITPSQAAGIAVSELPSWSSAHATVSVNQSTPNDPSTNQFTVAITIPAIYATPTNVLKWAYSSATLVASVTLQQEPSS